MEMTSLIQIQMLSVYDYQGAITGETCIEVLEAAHIHPYISNKSNHVQNGIVLRNDIHKLFDSGLLTINFDYNVLISPHLQSHTYLSYANEEIYLPGNYSFYPSQDALDFHNKMVFRK